MNQSRPQIESTAATAGNPEVDVETVIEQVWSDLGGAVTRAAIWQEIEQVLPGFEGARVTIYVPLFVRRQTVERLRTRLSGFSLQRHG